MAGVGVLSRWQACDTGPRPTSRGHRLFLSGGDASVRGRVPVIILWYTDAPPVRAPSPPGRTRVLYEESALSFIIVTLLLVLMCLELPALSDPAL